MPTENIWIAGKLATHTVNIHQLHCSMRRRTITFPSQRGQLVVECGESNPPHVSIYGDPEGLRSFGELLIAEAELEQKQFAPANLPEGERHHLHVLPGIHIHPQSLEVIIGRLDAKRTGDWPVGLAPARMKRIRPLEEDCIYDV